MNVTRADIRRKFVELLTDRTDVAERVFQNRARQLWPEELPAILVYSRNENITEFESAPRSVQRELRMAVEIVAKADEAVDDQLDAIAEQVEAIIQADDTLGGTVSDCLISDVEMGVAGEGETVFGSAILTFRVVYFREVVAQPDELGDLETVNIQYDLQNSDVATIEAEDRINIE